MHDSGRILCLLNMPPPLHGMSMINKSIIEGQLSKEFNLDVIGINTSTSLGAIEKFSFAKIASLLRIFLTLLIRLRRNKYSLCYFTLMPTGIGFYKDLIFVAAVKAFGVGIVYHLHGKGISKCNKSINRLLYKFCFKNSRVIILSEQLFYDIEKYVSRKDIYILPNGVKKILDDSDFAININKKNKNDSVNILFLSNMIKTKGVFVALEAARILRAKGYSFKLNFAGSWYDVTQDDFFGYIRKHSLEDIVKYVGFKSGSEKYGLFKSADIFVCPTYNDIFGIVNIEAMQFGLPVVTTREGIIAEVVDDGVTGFVVERKDSEALADKLEILIKNSGFRIKMGKAGRDKFLREYTFDRFEERLIAILSDAADKRGDFNIRCAE